MNRTIPTLAAATIAATALTGSASAGPACALLGVVSDG